MILRISVKCSDGFSCIVIDDKTGQVTDEYGGYVPDFMPGQHFGDYVELDIDPRNGQILNWNAPMALQAIKEGLE